MSLEVSLSTTPVWWQELLGWDLGKNFVADQRWLSDTRSECDYVALDGTIWTLLTDYEVPEGFVQCSFTGSWLNGCPGECAMPSGHDDAPHVWQQSCVVPKLVVIRLTAKALAL